MKIHNKDQKGISSSFGILIIVIVAIVAVGGAFAYQYVWNTDKQEEEPITENPQDETKIKLYYYNTIRDKEIAEYMPCSPDAILAIQREISATTTPVQDTIELLLQGELTEQEKTEGYFTEFPLEDFELENIDLDNGVLTLKFSDPLYKSSGGSCRVSILQAQVEKTAKQFPEVEQVKFQPDYIFQP
ncbi:MAG: GerMN domain-containing protein [Patescibacteria group bacterium]|nr:GerMN domain-containing protein [Patescibacteria group bacterium]